MFTTEFFIQINTALISEEIKVSDESFLFQADVLALMGVLGCKVHYPLLQYITAPAKLIMKNQNKDPN